MAELLDLIQTEHKSILKYLLILLNSDNTNYQVIVKYCNEIIQSNHHFKEETYIFNNLIDKPELLAGGPYCVLYFDEHVLNSPFSLVKELKKKLNISVKSDVSNHLTSMFSKKTPLNIPTEDHEACRQIVSMSRVILNSKKYSKTNLKHIFDVYTKLLTSHFEREENCLLKLVNSITTKSEKETIYNQFKFSNKPIINDSYIESYLYENNKIKLS
jgi:hemerythrin-like domain-containing protein